MFSPSQIRRLFFRLRQTEQELLYDVRSRQAERYKLSRRGGLILGVAHCDFVTSAWSMPKMIRPGTVRAGQVDDRVGVWLLLDILPEIIPTFDVLLTTDEEIGQSSAGEVLESLEYNWTFQFDRRGTDFVHYGLASVDFVEEFKRSTGIVQGIGSFSDICMLPDSCGSRVNVGTGYHNEHSPSATVDLQECFEQVQRFAQFSRDSHCQEFPVDTRYRPDVDLDVYYADFDRLYDSKRIDWNPFSS